MKNYSIQGELTLATPLHITQAFTNDRMGSDGKIISGTQGTPYTRTTRAPFINADGELVYLPVIQGNAIRGGLRRCLGDMIKEQIESRGETISLNVYHGLSCGTSTSSPKTDNKGSELVAKADDDLYVGLLGGTPFMFGGKLSVSQGVPMVQELLEAGLIGDEYEEDVLKVRRHTYPVGSIRKDDALEFRDPHAENVITDYRESIEEWQGELLGNREARAAARTDVTATRAAAKNLKQQMVSEFVPAGYKFMVRFDVKRCTDAQLGFLLMGLRKFAEQPIGGFTRVGAGRFSLSLRLFEGDEFVETVVNSIDHKVESDISESKPYIEAAEKALSEVSVKQLNEFFEVAR